MKKHLFTAALIVGFVGPALGADYYVALKVGGGGCVIMDHKPSQPCGYLLVRTANPTGGMY